VNLHCPARLILAGDPERVGRQQAAKVYTRSAPDAPAEALAARLGAPLGVVPALGDADLSGALQEIADQHRGETAVVLADPAALGLATDPAEIEHDGTGWWQP
jgi:hypothetical protein